MTPTNEDLLALADRLDAPDHWISGSADGHEGENTAPYEAAAALRVLVAERQAIRDKALEDAAQCCEAEADKCDDAVKWGGAPKYIANCKAAAYAMRDRAYTIRAMKGTTE